MPKFLEQRLRAEAAIKGLTGRDADRYVYGAMNNDGAMHGNKETAKGAAMQAKHDATVAPKRALHPALKQRAQMVREAHAHLSQAMPVFRQMSPAKQLALTQHHVKVRKGEA